MSPKNKADKSARHIHSCPNCGGGLEGDLKSYCPSCNITFITCPSCNTDYSKDVDFCPECGAETRKPMKGI